MCKAVGKVKSFYQYFLYIFSKYPGNTITISCDTTLNVRLEFQQPTTFIYTSFTSVCCCCCSSCQSMTPHTPQYTHKSTHRMKGCRKSFFLLLFLFFKLNQLSHFLFVVLVYLLCVLIFHFPFSHTHKYLHNQT